MKKLYSWFTPLLLVVAALIAAPALGADLSIEKFAPIAVAMDVDTGDPALPAPTTSVFMTGESSVLDERLHADLFGGKARWDLTERALSTATLSKPFGGAAAAGHSISPAYHRLI